MNGEKEQTQLETDQAQQLQEQRRLEDEADRKLRARVHRHMGMSAAVLGVIAAIVGLWWISKVFGVSPWTAVKEAIPLFLIVLVILGLGVVFSLGTSRLAYGIELLVKRYKKKKAGK